MALRHPVELGNEALHAAFVVEELAESAGRPSTDDVQERTQRGTHIREQRGKRPMCVEEEAGGSLQASMHEQGRDSSRRVRPHDT